MRKNGFAFECLFGAKPRAVSRRAFSFGPLFHPALSYPAAVTSHTDHRLRNGLLFGVVAYGLWGLIPLYFKLVASVTPLEVLAYRVVWSCLLLAVILTVVRQWGALQGVFRSRASMMSLLGSTVLIAVNWLIYIYAVTNDQVLQSSLGYFITPLMNVLLGVLVLGERLRKAQIAALALAATGVVILALYVGALPWIALSLAGTFSLYGLLRKTVAADSLVALSVETILLAPLCGLYLLALPLAAGLTARQVGALPTSLNMHLLLSFSGPMTVVPLLCFASAARRLRLTTLGILQYSAPTIQFVLAVLVFREPFSPTQLVSFCFIWAAVLIYTIESLWSYQNERRRAQLALREETPPAVDRLATVGVSAPLASLADESSQSCPTREADRE